MDNYSKVLEFFMENNIVLNKEQIEALKEEFLGEATDDQIKYMKEKLKGKITDDSVSGGFLGDEKNASTPQQVFIQGEYIDRSKDVKNLKKAKADLKNVENKAYKSGQLSEDRYGRHIVAKDNYSKIENKQNKIAGKAADKLFKEKEAWKDNETYNKITNKD